MQDATWVGSRGKHLKVVQFGNVPTFKLFCFPVMWPSAEPMNDRHSRPSEPVVTCLVYR